MIGSIDHRARVDVGLWDLRKIDMDPSGQKEGRRLTHQLNLGLLASNIKAGRASWGIEKPYDRQHYHLF